jgi:hypothetical protein
MQSWELEELERRAAAEERWEEEQEEDGPSLEEIASYVALGIFALGTIALVAGAAGGKNNDDTSPKDTPKGQEEETPSPAPVNNGNGIPAEPAPTPKVPVPAPVPQPAPTPAPETGTGQPPARCWVAREVYGYDNPSWLLFRDYLDFSAPTWFKKFYISHGEKIAKFIKDKPFLKKLIKAWMNTKI